MSKWFNSDNYEKVRVIEFKSVSDLKILKEVTISDLEFIKSLQAHINNLPTHGDMMISMGPNAQYLKLEFQAQDKIDTIEFYNKQIKTIATSFYSDIEDIKKEKLVWAEIRALVEKPDYGKRIPKLLNVGHKFDKFIIEYLGSEDRTPKDATATRYVATYKVINNADQTIKNIEVSSGQLPPEAVDFAVGQNNYTLITYSNDNVEQIYPRYFIIRKK